LCGKDGKWALSVAGAFQPRLKLPSSTTHTYYFFVTALRSSIMAKVLQGSKQQPDDFKETLYFYERNDLVLFILSVTQGGYNMNIRCT